MCNAIVLAHGDHHVSEEVRIDNLKLLIEDFEHRFLQFVLWFLHLAAAIEGLC